MSVNLRESIIFAVQIFFQKAAIGWYFVAIQEEKSNSKNWLENIGIQNISIHEKYIYSIYWSITTMTTVGYGDISATNSTEALYIAITMILFSCVFAYSINNIGFILQEIEKSSKQLNDDLSTIQRKNVSIQLKSRVRHYLSFLAQEQKDRDKLQEDKILCELSNKLRDEISLEINTKILNNYHLFSFNFSKSTLNKLIFIMKEILVNPNEIIIRENESDDSSIYFIQSGIIEIYQQQIQKHGQINVIKTLKDGQIFGDISFFSGLQRQASARSVNLSTLYKITREEFIEVLKQNKEDFEHFKMMQDEIIFQKEKSIIYNACYFCKESSHIANQCPRTHKLMDKQFVILKSNFSMFQERSQYQMMNLRRKQNAKAQLKRNLEQLKNLKQNYQQQGGDNFFIFEENLLSSDDNTITRNSNDDEEENTQSLNTDQLEEKDFSKKKSTNFMEKERTEKTINNFTQKTLQTDKTVFSYNEEIDSQLNQEYQIQGCHSNLIYENQDQNKIVSKSFNSQPRIRSFDAASESVDSINQESNKVLYSKDTEQSKKPEQLINHSNNKDGSSQNTSKILDKQKFINQQNNYNILSAEQHKNQVKKKGNNNLQARRSSFQMSNLSQEDNNNQDCNQFQQNSKLECNKKERKHKQYSSHKNLFGMSQKQLNSSFQEKINPVDQTLQSIATLLYLQGRNVSSQQINSGNYYHQENSSNNLGSNQYKESMLNHSLQKINIQSYNKINLQENSAKLIKNQTSNDLINKELSRDDLTVINRISKILQQSQIQFLLQLTNGKSYQNLDSQFNNPMDYFDKIQNFKKFYPENNFDKVIHKLKIIQQQQKKQKKFKLASKERRHNIGLTKLSIFQQGSNHLMKIINQNYKINKNKPTYLSYGIKQQQGVLFPNNNFLNN